MRGAQINSDRNLRLQYLAGWSVNASMGAEILSEIRGHQKFPENLFVGPEAPKQRLKSRLRKLAGAVEPTAAHEEIVHRTR